MEPFLPGESVTLTDTDHTIGHIVAVDDAAGTVEVRWLRRPGHDHDVTVEPTSLIRRLHESEDGTL
jgi:hypothetical protein